MSVAHTRVPCRLPACSGLNNNQIAVVEPGAFDGCLKLTILNLQNNQLVEIRAGVFQLGASLAEGVTNTLRNLKLGGNPIARVDPGAFDGVPALTDAATRALIENVSPCAAGRSPRTPALVRSTVRRRPYRAGNYPAIHHTLAIAQI